MNLFFIFIFIFIMVNCMISWIQTHLLFGFFLRIFLLFLDDNVNEECEQFSNSKSLAWWCCLAFCLIFFANFSMAFLIKVCVIKKRVLLSILGRYLFDGSVQQSGWGNSHLWLGFGHRRYRVFSKANKKLGVTIFQC